VAITCPKCGFDNPEDTIYCGKCATRLDSTPQISVTRTLETTADELTRGVVFAGRYEIIEELGTGGMGRVYRAFDKKIDEEVALKLLKPEIAADRKTVERFRNELRIARKISHHNVCRMHDLNEEGKTLYITMEYVRGEDLKSVIHRMGILRAGKTVSIARQVAEGLAEAHKLGIIHRDLKPHNIMVDQEGNAKIMDFGIARSLRGTGITREGAIIGTPEYMSPEQVEGKPADQRADIYALGVTLFEMVTGRPPFEGETSLAVAHKHKYEPAPDPRTLNPQIPAGLSRLILRCLEKDKEKRFQTAEGFLADLEAVEASLPTAERMPAGRPTTRRKPAISKKITVEFTPRRLLIPVLALVAIVAVVIALIKFLPKKGLLPSQNRPQSIAVLPFTDLSPDKDQAVWCEGIAETLLNALVNVKGLQVRGKHSSFLFTVQDDPREVGRKLNAEKILTGSLQKLGNRVRITVQLVNTADGTPLWSEKRDGEMEEIFDIQDLITSMIVSRMNVGLTEGESSRLEKRYTNNKEAYDLSLKGNYFVRQMTPDSNRKAISFFLEAIKRDPAYVVPYVALARCYQSIYLNFGEGDKEEIYRLSREALTRAFDLDKENGGAYAARASLKFDFENDPAGAEIDYRRALQLSPNNSAILEDHFWYLAARYRLDEAVSEMKLLIELEPLYPAGYTWLGLLYYFSRRYDDSKANFQKALELDPDFLSAIGWSFHTYIAVGDYGQALEMVNRLENMDTDGHIAELTILEVLTGKRNEAAKRKEAEKGVFNSPVWAAIYYAVMGDRDQTLLNLTRIYDESPHSWRINFFYHYFDKYRSDPEFVKLFQKCGFKF
jgi:serine/threonine protein kinase/Tfp pilus assembly protein PilF